MSLTATFLKRASGDVNRPSSYQGLPIIIETPKGGIREGDLPDGTHWEKEMLADYGYIPATSGSGDQEPVDVYVGEDESAEYAYAVEQLDDKGEFDEYKVFLGFPDLLSAEKCYTDMWGDKNLGDIDEIPLKYLFDAVAENQNQVNKTGADQHLKGVYNPELISKLHFSNYIISEEEYKTSGVLTALLEGRTAGQLPYTIISGRTRLGRYEVAKDLQHAGVLTAMVQKLYELTEYPINFDSRIRQALKHDGGSDSIGTVLKTSASVPKLIMRFLDSYDFEFYEHVALEVQEFLEDIFQADKIKALVTSRAKRTRSLRDKLMNRNNKNQYEDLAAIQQDIKDLAGVRVALYFPHDQEKVRAIIESNFEQARPVKEFPRDADPEDGQIYRALHYTVWYEGTVVEIQAASILMHALQEVNHDLGYKPSMGQLSEAEVQILEMLGALVGAGESSIDELQGEIERRTGCPLQTGVVAHLKRRLAAARYHLTASEDFEIKVKKAKKTRLQKLCERRGETEGRVTTMVNSILN
jgi:ppGpp synthetase/RelA/SpoT-type nucleotidyltranferase